MVQNFFRNYGLNKRRILLYAKLFLKPTADWRKSITAETGYSLVFSLFLMILLSCLTVIMIQLYAIEKHIIQNKIDYLTVKYSTESTFYETVTELSRRNLNESGPMTAPYPSEKDSNLQLYRTLFPFGGYHYLKVESVKRQQCFTLQSLLGQPLTADFEFAVITNPEHGGLILTEDSRISGDICTGPAGVKPGSLNGQSVRESARIAGNVFNSKDDYRPRIDYSFVQNLYRDFQRYLQMTDLPEYSERIYTGCEQQVGIKPGNSEIFLVSAHHFDMNASSSKGPAVLVSRYPVTIQDSCRIGPWVILVSEQEILIDGPVEIENSILYSKKKVSVQSCISLQAQIFSESAIFIGEGISMRYPSLMTVLTRGDSGSIRLSTGSELNGSACYLSDPARFTPNSHPGRIHIPENAVVNGLLYSDHDMTINGSINGIAITNRFYLYRSPMICINWLAGAKINRLALRDEFSLPLFFKSADFHMKPVEFQ
jgi:hypothetical protein